MSSRRSFPCLARLARRGLLAGLLGLALLAFGCASPSSRPDWEGQATPESRELARALTLPARWQAVAVGTARVRGLREDILCVLAAGEEPGAPLRVLVYHLWGLRLAELAVSQDQVRVLEARPVLFRIPNLDARMAKALQRSLMLRPDAQSGAAGTPGGLTLRRKQPSGAAIEWSVDATGRVRSIEGLGTERFQAQWQGQGPLSGLPELFTYRDPQDGFSLSLGFPADQQTGMAGGPSPTARADSVARPGEGLNGEPPAAGPQAPDAQAPDAQDARSHAQDAGAQALQSHAHDAGAQSPQPQATHAIPPDAQAPGAIPQSQDAGAQDDALAPAQEPQARPGPRRAAPPRHKDQPASGVSASGSP